MKKTSSRVMRRLIGLSLALAFTTGPGKASDIESPESPAGPSADEWVPIRREPDTASKDDTPPPGDVAPPEPRMRRAVFTWPYIDRETLIHSRLSIGFRMLHFTLKHSRQGEPFRGSFIGSINKLEEVQDYRPVRLFLTYALCPYLGIGVQYDRLEIKTLTTLPPDQLADNRNTDGNAVMRGFLPYLFVQWPNRTPCTPFAEYGRAWYRNSFHPHPDWYAGGRRHFLLDSAQTYYWAMGLDVEITEQFHLDVYFRAMDVDVPGNYRFRGDDRPLEPFVFTLKHTAFGVGARMVF